MRRLLPLPLVLSVLMGLGAGVTVPSASAEPVGSASRFVPLEPARVLDTRTGLGARRGVVPPRGEVVLRLPGSGGVPASGATAVVLNMTITASTAAGFVQAYPTGRSTAGAFSNQNVTGARQTVAGLVTAPLGDDGAVTLYSSGGGHLLADVLGYYAPSGATSAGRFLALPPSRLLDTRSGAKPARGADVVVQATGRAGVPVDGVSAVALNVTATQATAAGFVQALPTGGSTRTGSSSNVNVTAAGQTIANLVVVPVGRDGRVTLHTSSGTHLLADVAGYYTDDSAASSVVGLYQPIVPRRVLDTRTSGGQVQQEGTLVSGPVGARGVPWSGVSAVALGVTVIAPDLPGFVQVFPTGRSTAGSSSNVNVHVARQTIAGAVLTPPGEGNDVSLYASRRTHLALDVFGWFLGAGAGAGELDQDHGSDGLARLRVGAGYSEAVDLAVDGSGRTVLAGMANRAVGVARLLPDGRPDPSFGDGGQVVTPVGDLGGRADAVVVQPDGKIVAAGHVSPTRGQLDADFLVVRYTADGRLDPSFGDGGRVATSFAGPAYATALLLQPDGRLIAVGHTATSPDLVDTDVALARYLPDGRLDPSFGDGGTVTTDVRGGPDLANSAVLRGDGTVVVGGITGQPDPSAPATSTWLLAAYRGDGSPDASFGGGDGIAEHDLSAGSEHLAALALQPDGRLLGAGHVDPQGTAPRVAVARYLPDGSPDTTFDGDGVALTEAALLSEGAAVVAQPDGRVVVAGRAADDTLDGDPDWDWLLVRYGPGGGLDPTFGSAGVLRTPGLERANAVRLLQDGALLVAGCDCPLPPFGRGDFPSSSSFVVGRYDAATAPRR